jgi:hypothetical protein
MKKIDPKATTTKRARCPFCSYGCEFGVVFYDLGLKGVEYIEDGSSGGRLCPRGSAAALYLDHRHRLSSPMKNGGVIGWKQMIDELKKAVAKPESLAVTFDRNITLEEYRSIMAFCQEKGIKHVASSYFEPESYLSDFLKGDFSEDDIQNAQSVVILGDPFNQTPMSSKSIINWRLGSRDRRLVVIDSVSTHTAAFANDFLKVKIGTEPLLLFALAKRDLPGIDISKVTGIPGDLIKDISDNFRNAENGFIIACLPFGRTYDALLVAEGLKSLAAYSKKQVIPFVEFAGYRGTMNFGTVLDAIKKRRIKKLINFGELFPFYYPQLFPGLKNVSIYATSTLKYDGCTVLPAALNLEKSGTIMTTFGAKTLPGEIAPASGSKTVHGILSLLSASDVKSKIAPASVYNIDIDSRASKIAAAASGVVKKDHFKLIGEKIAYYFLTFFEKEILKMNPADAAELGLRQGDYAAVESKSGSCNLPVHLTRDVDPGIVAVPVESPEIRGLFDFVMDDQNQTVNFVPTEVKICRKE